MSSNQYVSGTSSHLYSYIYILYYIILIPEKKLNLFETVVKFFDVQIVRVHSHMLFLPHLGYSSRNGIFMIPFDYRQCNVSKQKWDLELSQVTVPYSMTEWLQIIVNNRAPWNIYIKHYFENSILNYEFSP